MEPGQSLSPGRNKTLAFNDFFSTLLSFVFWSYTFSDYSRVVEEVRSLNKTIFTPPQHQSTIHVSFRTTHSQQPIYLIQLFVLMHACMHDQEGQVKKGMAIHSSILAWKSP